MVIRLKGATIESVEETETKGLRSILIDSKDAGATLFLELPEALCDRFHAKSTIDVVLDDDVISKGDEAKLYAEGRPFRISTEQGIEVIGSVGGLRFVFKMEKTTPARRKTFESGVFYLTLD